MRQSEAVALTRDFRETIRERAETDAAFRESLLLEGVRLLDCGEVAVGAAVLRNAIDAVSDCSSD